MRFKIKWHCSLFSVSPDLDGVPSMPQPSASSSIQWTTSPETPLMQYCLYRRNWISSTFIPFLISTASTRVSSSNNQGLIPTITQYKRRPLPSFDRNSKVSSSSKNDYRKNGISSSNLLSKPLSDGKVAIPPSERRQYPSFDNKCKLSHSPQQSLNNNDMSMPSSTNNYLRVSSPPPDNELEVSTTLSYAMRLSNYHLLKHDEFPMILFDGNGEMHTNYYPPTEQPGYENTQITDDDQGC